VNGQAYGFVRFSNVCDVGKLSKALNNICFGNYWVFAKVARYDRFENSKEMETEGMLRVREREIGKKGVEGEKSERVGNVIGGSGVFRTIGRGCKI